MDFHSAMYVSSPTWQIQKFKIHCSLTARLSHASPRGKCKSVFNNIQIKSQRLSMWSKWDKLLHWSVWQISAVEQAEKIIQKFQVRGSLRFVKNGKDVVEEKKSDTATSLRSPAVCHQKFSPVAMLDSHVLFQLLSRGCFQLTVVTRCGSLHRQYLVRG